MLSLTVLVRTSILIIKLVYTGTSNLKVTVLSTYCTLRASTSTGIYVLVLVLVMYCTTSSTSTVYNSHYYR